MNSFSTREIIRDGIVKLPVWEQWIIRTRFLKDVTPGQPVSYHYRPNNWTLFLNGLVTITGAAGPEAATVDPANW